MKKTFGFIICLSLLLATSCAHKKEVSPQYSKLDETLTLISEHEKAMGNVLVYEKGHVAYERTFGFKNMPEDPIFRIGSISKTYTAVIIAKMVEEGLLHFEDKVSKFYPQVPHANQITIEHLLRHRSGLVSFTDLPEYLSYGEKLSTETDHLKRMAKNGTEFKAGSKKSYSNTGYVLLSLIAQKVSAKTYSELLKEYIVDPIGLENTYVFNSKEPRSSEVKSYERLDAWKESTNTHESVPLGAGAIASTSREVGRFLYALFHNKIVKEETLKRMSLMTDNYGHGLFTVPYGKKTGIGHTGGIDGFRSIATYFKDSDTVFVQLLNASAMDSNQISLGMLASFYKDPFEVPTFKQLAKVPLLILEKYEGKFKAPDFPLEVNIFIKNDELYAQAQGQPAFPLEAYSNNEFGFPAARIEVKFIEDGNSFEFKQGKSFLFTKVK